MNKKLLCSLLLSAFAVTGCGTKEEKPDYTKLFTLTSPQEPACMVNAKVKEYSDGIYAQREAAGVNAEDEDKIVSPLYSETTKVATYKGDYDECVPVELTVAVGEGGNGGEEPPVVETTIASWLATSETNKNNVETGVNSNGTYYKLKDSNSYIEYKFNSTVAGKAYLKANAGTKKGNATAQNKLWFDGSTVKFTFTVNGTNVAITDNSTTFADVGMGNSGASGTTSGDSGDPAWVEFPEITIKTGENTIKIQRTAGYTLYFYEFKVVTR